MRFILTIITTIIILTGCSSNNTSKNEQHGKTNNESINDNSAKVKEVDHNCDSLKFSDFKNNLKEIQLKHFYKIEKEITSIAKTFIEKQCKENTLYCCNIYLKHKNYFLSPKGFKLFSFGYAFKNAETVDKLSANFFFFGIRKNSKTIFYDIAADLDGEIQLNLKGLQIVNNQTVIWGEAYPFLDKNYGKFKLTVTNKKKKYEFECYDKSG